MVMDYANMFCGSGPQDDQASNHLTLTEVKLPAMDVTYVDHRAAGAPIAIEINTVMARLECTFVCLGIVTQVSALVDSWLFGKREFFVYGNVRDQTTGEAYQAAAMMVGQLGRADPQNFRKGDVMHTNYAIREIIHYEFGVANQLLYYWDYFTNTRVFGPDNMNSKINANLHVNSPAPAVYLTNFQLAPTIGGAGVGAGPAA